MKTILVDASKKYEVYIGNDVLKDAGFYIARRLGLLMERNAGKKYPTAVIISDDNVFPLHGQDLKQHLEEAGFTTLEYIFPHGEASKTLETAVKIQSFMSDNGITRSDIVVALGGGVVGDLAGFVASTYKRGLDYVQVPTTLMAAVDSSVGGKTAVNTDWGKNQMGTIYQPVIVLCDTTTLRTLPEKEYINGCAEVIKYGMIGGEFLDSLKHLSINSDLTGVISECVSIKRDYIERDEGDHRERRMLNFGHTIGHAIEKASGYTVPHGFAVAMGMAEIARQACIRNICEPSLVYKLEGLLEQYELPYKQGYGIGRREDIIRAAMDDKKSSGEKMTLVVPEKPGKCRFLEIETAQLPDWIGIGD